MRGSTGIGEQVWVRAQSQRQHYVGMHALLSGQAEVSF